MPLKSWCSIHERCSKSSLKHSIGFCGIFPSSKPNFITYRFSKVSSRPDCLFKIHQLWQSGFSRVYSNCCCNCSFDTEIIKISQSSHKMYSNNILNIQESATILDAYTKKSGILLNEWVSLKIWNILVTWDSIRLLRMFLPNSWTGRTTHESEMPVSPDTLQVQLVRLGSTFRSTVSESSVFGRSGLVVLFRFLLSGRNFSIGYRSTLHCTFTFNTTRLFGCFFRSVIVEFKLVKLKFQMSIRLGKDVHQEHTRFRYIYIRLGRNNVFGIIHTHTHI